MIPLWLMPLVTLPLFYDLQLVVPAQTRVTKRLLFVVDTSGSMRGGKFEAAAEALVRILEQPVDEVEFGVLAFSNQTRRWEGIPEPDLARPVPEGWAGLPSLEAIEAAAGFVGDQGANGDTFVIPALEEALAEERDQLSVVLVTDGIFQREDSEQILAAVSAAQEQRRERGLGEAVLVVYGVGGDLRILRSLGEVGLGGFYREVPDRQGIRPAPPIQGLQDNGPRFR
jgi:von Willebrand factor type A domain